MPDLNPLLLVVAGAAFAAAFSAEAQDGSEIGAAWWANSEARGKPPASTDRRIVAGLGMVQREVVTTNTTGGTSIVFDNNARLQVGTGCRVTLDNRFYDPSLDRNVTALSNQRVASRCVVELDTGAVAANERVVLSGAQGDIVVEGQVTTLIADLSDGDSDAIVQALSDDAPGPEGGPAGVRTLTLVSAVGPGGLVIANGVAIRRAGFAVYTDFENRQFGPYRVTGEEYPLLLSALNASAAQPSPLVWILDPRLRDASPALPPARAPTTCLRDACETRFEEIDDGLYELIDAFPEDD